MTENQTPSTKPAKVITTNRCACGCGEATSSSRTAYKPGHDARHAGSVARDLAAFWINGGKGVNHSMLDELSSPKLQAKATTMAKRIVEQVAAKATAASKPSKAASKKADKKATAAIVAQEEAAHTAVEQVTMAPAEPMWSEDESAQGYKLGGPVKVGRWEYPSRQNHFGNTERNTKRDGSGDWIAYEG